jgi:hypothetical protein
LNLPLSRSSITAQFTQPLFIFHLIAVIVLWVFVWMHAFTMDITHDEAYSFKLIKTSYYRAMPGSANTHWLNSFFMKLFSLLLGDAPGVLRLHVVLAFPFFAQAVYRLATQINIKSIQFAFYSLVLFNPYVLDFFSVARGYGLALLFQAWTFVFLLQAAISPFQYRKWLVVVCMSVLTIGGNLSYLYTIMGVTGLFILHMVSNHPFAILYRNRQVRTICLLLGALIVLTIADLLFVKYYGKDLDYGGDENFVQSLFGSVWEGGLYFARYPYVWTVLTWSSFILLSVACGYFILKQVGKNKFTTGFITGVPVAAILLLSVVFHLVLKTPYLLGRTALQWYVPGLLTIGLALGRWLPAYKPYRLVATACTVGICAGVGYHFTRVASTRMCFEWYWQVPSKQSLYDLYDLHPQQPAIGPLNKGVYINYYSLVDTSLTVPYPLIMEENNKNICTDSLKAVLRKSDYILTSYPGTLTCLQNSGLSWSTIKTYPGSNLKLLKINH